MVPDLDWYSSVSSAKGLTMHCPFATVEACPRYYQSLSLLPETGTTEIAADEDTRLLEKWKKSDLWPRIDEHATSVSKADSRLSMICNFCPEVTFDRFGYFCTFLSTYVDEIDSDSAHRRLRHENAQVSDPRWTWSGIVPQHYSECSLYSILNHRSVQMVKGPSSGTTVNIQNSHGIQIGDQNVQTITISIQALVDKINGTAASETEKVEAKTMLLKFLENPLVTAIVGGLVSNLNP